VWILGTDTDAVVFVQRDWKGNHQYIYHTTVTDAALVERFLVSVQTKTGDTIDAFFNLHDKRRVWCYILLRQPYQFFCHYHHNHLFVPIGSHPHRWGGGVNRNSDRRYSHRESNVVNEAMGGLGGGDDNEENNVIYGMGSFATWDLYTETKPFVLYCPVDPALGDSICQHISLRSVKIFSL
jgi:hypothetical protein